MNQLGKLLMIGGTIVLIIGIILYFSERIPWLGRLPGDILVKKKNFTFYFPVVTCIILSLVISLIFIIINKIK